MLLLSLLGKKLLNLLKLTLVLQQALTVVISTACEPRFIGSSAQNVVIVAAFFRLQFLFQLTVKRMSYDVSLGLVNTKV